MLICNVCALAQTALLLSRRLVTSFGRVFWPLVNLYLGVFDQPKGTSFECAESIYVKITEAACALIRRRRSRRRKEEDGQIVSLGDSRIKDRIAILSMLKVRV